MSQVMYERPSSEPSAELRAHLGDVLGIGRPVSAAVAAAIVTHQGYARYLMAAQGNLPVLEHLMASPPPSGRSAVRFATVVPDTGAESTRSAAALLMDASRSLLRWAGTAFQPVDDDIYERRLAACARCEHFVEPPDRLVYTIVTAGDRMAKVCALCGCVTSRKARMPHESCPAIDPYDPALTRWGEPAASRSA